MKNILIVTAHPSKAGKTHQIADTYRIESEKVGHTVTVLDLYAPENALPFLSFETLREWPKSEQQERMKRLMAAADELVFVHPVWWSGAPAILKNWIDTIFEAGFAFRYGAKGKIEKLLTGKTGKVFVTAGGPAFIYSFFLSPVRMVWNLGILGFCGVQVTDLQVLGSMNTGTPEERSARLEKFLDKVKQSAGK